MFSMARRLTKKAFMALIGIGLVLVAIATYGLIHFLVLKYTGSSAPGDGVVISSGVPSERTLTVGDDYSVPDDRPRRLIINTIGVDSYIQRIGITESGAMAAPNNILLTGWYVHGVVPGEPGLAVINGHEGGSYSDGVFKRLRELKQDDQVAVEMGDRSLRLFSVERVDSFPVGDAAVALFNDDQSIERELRLITCEGRYDLTKGTFDQRTIVVARSLEETQ